MAILFSTLMAIYGIIALVVSMSVFGLLLGPLVWFLALLPFVGMLQYFTKQGDRYNPN